MGNFDESQHPRGQPQNRGEFAPKAGGGKGAGTQRPPEKSFATPEAEAAHVADAIRSTAAFKAGERALAAERSAYMAKDKAAFLASANLAKRNLRAVVGAQADAAVEELSKATGRPPEKLRAVAVKARQMADHLATSIRGHAQEWTAKDAEDFPNEKPEPFHPSDVHRAFRDTVADLVRDARGDIKAGPVSDILEKHFLGTARTPDQRDLAELSPFYEKAPAARREAARRVQAVYRAAGQGG
jgi:hypothetical protein